MVQSLKSFGRYCKNSMHLNPLILFPIFFIAAFGCSSVPEMKQVEGPKFLIVNGDDLCLDEQTDQAILTAYKMGVLTSTTAFINLPDAPKTLIKIHNDYPDLSIGLHLNITQGRPVAPVNLVKSLTDNNEYFFDIENILSKLADISHDELKTELRSQIDLFLSTGVPLSHLDYHHHILALYTPFFEMVRELAIEYDLPVRNPVPVSIYKQIQLKEKSGGGGDASMKKLIWYAIKHPVKSMKMRKQIGPEAFIQQERLMISEEIKSPDWFIDLFYNNATVENIIDILNQLPPGVSEVMCHPGISQELEVLTNAQLAETLEKLQIELIDYSYFKRN